VQHAHTGVHIRCDARARLANLTGHAMPLQRSHGTIDAFERVFRSMWQVWIACAVGPHGADGAADADASWSYNKVKIASIGSGGLAPPHWDAPGPAGEALRAAMQVCPRYRRHACPPPFSRGSAHGVWVGLVWFVQDAQTQALLNAACNKVLRATYKHPPATCCLHAKEGRVAHQRPMQCDI
jgi:hypothetical protein